MTENPKAECADKFDKLKNFKKMLTKPMEQSAEIENQADKPEQNAAESSIVELNAPVWSVVSIDKRLARNLTYQHAIEKIK